MKEKEKDDKIDNLYNNFTINKKEPIQRLYFHTGIVNYLTLLNDGRLVSCSDDKNIIIYNKSTYKPDLMIKEHNNFVSYITKLSSGLLASSSGDKTIKLFNINGNNYEIFQILNYHKDFVFKIKELKNNKLVSISKDKSILIYFKDNFKYQKDYRIETKGIISSITQTKENEICYLETFNKSHIYFFDLIDKKIKKTISNISCNKNFFRTFDMITKDLLVVGGENKISIININIYQLIRIIEVCNSNIFGFCSLNENAFLIGDDNGVIMQWKIEGNNLILISKKEKAHDSNIYSLIKLGDGNIATCSRDKSIRIWK